MTVNVVVKHKNKSRITTDDVCNLMTFCDSTFGMKDDETYWFQQFATDGDAIYCNAEDQNESLDIKLFNQYKEEYPEMSVYVEYVM